MLCQKRGFIIEKQIARHFVHFQPNAYQNHLSFYETQIINPFLKTSSRGGISTNREIHIPLIVPIALNLFWSKGLKDKSTFKVNFNTIRHILVVHYLFNLKSK